MKLVLLVVLITTVVLILLSTGYYLSYKIIEPLEKFFFWILYLLSILTLLSIVLVIFGYLRMRTKSGPRGPKGVKGPQGEIGETGYCDVSCRNNTCQTILYEHIISVLNALDKDNGGLGDLKVETDLRNPYIKEKIKSMCLSDEYQKTVPFKGVETLNNYIKSIWTEITTLLYNNGGLNYFRTIGAEYDWDWMDNNPWDEFKKYDIYYWGMGKEYLPRIKEESITNNNSKDIYETDEYPVKENSKYGNNGISTSELDTTTEQKAIKYSILGYLNVPLVENDGKSIIIKVKDSARKVVLYNVHTFENSEEILSQYTKTMNIRYLNPLSYLVSNVNSPHKCFTGKENKMSVCNSFNKDYIFNIEIIDNENSKMNEFYLQHTETGLYLNINSGNKLTSKDNATIFLFN